MCVCVCGGGGGLLDLTQSPVHLQGRWGRVCVCVEGGGGGGDLTQTPVHLQGRWGRGRGFWISPSSPFIFKVGERNGFCWISPSHLFIMKVDSLVGTVFEVGFGRSHPSLSIIF